MPSAHRVTMVTAAKVLRNPKIWVVPTTLVGLVALLLSLIYLGGILNPRGNLHRMPIGLVNADHGAQSAGQQVNLGAQITAQIAAAPDPQRQVAWRVLDEAGAKNKLTSGQVYAVLEVAPDFSTAVTALGAPDSTPRPGRP